MIMNSNGSSTVTTVGDVQENQISIDQKNLEHIITILSSNLYSHPEQSFLREIVSNAIDAQVEAKSEEPAIISVVWDASSNSYILAIRDYGTGLSPERFKEIFLNIGSSTKRDTNDYIGSFGVGRFSALACADMVHITSYYDGTQYNYLMLKNGSKINIDLISTQATTEHNGVEVKIKVSSIWSYINSLRYLWFVPNVYVHAEGYDLDSRMKIERFNDRILYRFNTFAYNNTGEDTYFVLLGNILYPIDCKYIPATYNGGDNLRYIWRNIIPQFNIGDLDITPNREQLLYSDKTIKAIEGKFEEVANELIDICTKLSERTFTNLFEYYQEVTSSYLTIYLPSDNENELRLTLTKDCFLRKYIQYTYKNDPMADSEEVRKAIANLRYTGVTNVFNNASVFANGNYLTQRMINRARWETKSLLDNDTDVRLFFVPTMEGTKSDIFKAYLKEKAATIEAKGKRAVFIFTTDYPSIRKLMKNTSFTIMNGYETDVHKTLWFLRELESALKGHIFVHDLAHSKAFLDYRKEVLEQRKLERKNNSSKFNQTIRFYISTYGTSYGNERNRKIDLTGVSGLLATINDDAKYYLKTSKPVPVYWGVMDDPYLDIWSKLIERKQSFIVVTVAKTNVKYLERAELPKNWYKVDAEFILNSRAFRKWMTCYDKQVVVSDTSLDLLRKTNDALEYPEVEKVRRYSCSNLNNVNDHAALEYLKTNYKGYYDQSMLEGYDLLKKYNDLVLEMKGILSLNDWELTPLSMYTAMKRKIVRPNWEEYQRITRAFNPKTEETDEENN